MSTLKEDYYLLLSIRDTLPLLKSEISELEEEEIIKKYLELTKYYDTYKSLENKPDTEIFEQLIKNDNSLLEDIYFCYGNNYPGYQTRIGTYYIKNKPSSIKELKPYILLAKYRNLRDPQDVIIMPREEQDSFNQSHSILNYKTENPELEYLQIRKKLYLEELHKQESEIIARGK